MCDKDKAVKMFGAVVILPCQKCKQKEEYDKKQMVILMKQSRSGVYTMSRNQTNISRH